MEPAVANDYHSPIEQGGSENSLADYDLIRRSIEYLTLNWRSQPSLDDLADHIGLSQSHMQRLFTRWTGGLSPKGFIQAVTLDHAKHLLDQSASVMEAAFEVGLSGPSRLHDLFVTHEAITPGTYKAKGEGLIIRYGLHPCPLRSGNSDDHRSRWFGRNGFLRYWQGTGSPAGYDQPLAQGSL